MTVAPDTDANPPLEAAAAPPSVPAPSAEPPPVDLTPAKAVPPPRKPNATQSAQDENNEQEAANHPQAPRIAPQISPGDVVVYQRKVDEDSAVASRNLQSTDGRQLNATQQDMADKIRSWLDQARDAGKGGDWTRAQNLASKARNLSVELVNSL